MSILNELGIRKNGNKLKEELLYTLSSSYALLEREIGKILSPYGLSPVKMNALLVIKHIGRDEGISQVDICKKMIVTAGNMTGLVNRLEKQKLVSRFARIGDKRVNTIKITKKGAMLLDQVWPIYKKKVNQLIPLSETKTTAVITGLSELREEVGKLSKDL